MRRKIKLFIAKIPRKTLIATLINALCVVMAAVGVLRMMYLSNALASQRMAERWRGDNEAAFAQVSYIMPPGSELTEENIYKFRSDLAAKLTENSLKAPEGASLWTDAYSAAGQVRAAAVRGSADALAIGVGGEFFAFHPLHLRSGVYMTGGDLMRDRVVLDTDMAWKLFGATDVVGMQLNLDGQPFIVAGVVEREQDFASKLAFPDSAGLFVPLEALSNPIGPICYEIVMPNPIDNFAENLVRDTFPIKGGDVVENSGRYSVSGMWEMLKTFGKRSMQSALYPYWENAARAVEDHMALAFFVTVLFSLVPMLFLAAAAIRLFRRVYARRGEVRLWLERAYDRYQTAQWEKKQP